MQNRGYPYAEEINHINNINRGNKGLTDEYHVLSVKKGAISIRRGSIQHSALVTKASHECDHLVFFQLLAYYPEDLVTVFQVYGAGSSAKTAGNGIHNGILILRGADVCFEDADHVP